MEIRFNRTGAARKELVTAISGITGWAPVYQKAPTFAYVVNNYTIDKDGTLIYDERTDAGSVRELLAELAARGFVPEDAPAENGIVGDDSLANASAEDIPGEEARGGDVPGDGDPVGDDVAAAGDTMPEAPAVDARDDGAPETNTPVDVAPDKLSIEVPLEGFTATALDNLEKLVASKAALIMKSIGTDALPIARESDRLRFPWFTPGSSPEEVAAYTQFVAALCEMAKKQRRVVAKEKPADSEKFAFRCFLLRLGFIGEAYASARKILLRNLPGDGSFKSGKRKDRSESEALPVAANTADSGAQSEAESGAGKDDMEAHGAEHARESGAINSCALSEALADAELIHGVNALFETGLSGGGGNE